ncbi:MAG TPA: UDP-N-acetylenolpyruvoylglucosamine reductase [Ruminococcaceae bacterium]|nr:UDP-N-acetylenolpyruvoylglucosamine reductase [Oscillospiraceae bacterium]
MLLRENAPLREYCSMRVGGPARLAAFPETAEELAALLRAGGRRVVLGGGSNVLFPDEGYDGTVIFTTRLCGLTADGCMLSAQAGVPLSAAARRALECGLGGLAFAYGIPGTVGGGVYMNAGAYGGQIADCLVRATLLDAAGEPRVVPASELALGYRSSALMDGDWTLLSADFALVPAPPEEIRAEMERNMQARREKQPLELPSAGSVFKRPEGYFAGTLIEQCGLKGFAVGGACVSEKHAGFIVNKGGATCADVEALIRAVQDTVFQATGVELEPEIRRISLSE